MMSDAAVGSLRLNLRPGVLEDDDDGQKERPDGHCSRRESSPPVLIERKAGHGKADGNKQQHGNDGNPCDLMLHTLSIGALTGTGAVPAVAQAYNPVRL